jgi:hypothetical protein
MTYLYLWYESIGNDFKSECISSKGCDALLWMGERTCWSSFLAHIQDRGVPLWELNLWEIFKVFPGLEQHFFRGVR